MTLLQIIGLGTLVKVTYKIGNKAGYRKGFNEGRSFEKDISNYEVSNAMKTLISNLEKSKQERQKLKEQRKESLNEILRKSLNELKEVKKKQEEIMEEFDDFDGKVFN